MNVVILHGNLTADPEVRYTPKGQAICNFTLAINKRWKTESGEEKEKVGFFGCYIWGKRGEVFAENLKKGRCVYCEGRVSVETYEKDGKKETKTQVVVEEWQFVGGPRTDEGQAPAPRPAAQQAPKQPAEQPADDADLEVPF